MAWHFDEVNDYVTLTDDSALTCPDSDWAIAGWIKLDDNTGSAFQYFISWGANPAAQPNLHIVIDEPNGDLQAYAVDAQGDGLSLEGGTDEFSSNTNWTHIFMQRSGDDITVYINGVSYGSVTDANMDEINVSGDFYFGARSDLNVDRFFGGDMAEWAKWNRALSTDEISTLAKGYAPSFFIRDLAWYVPMIRSYRELQRGLAVTNNGSTVVEHPRMIYPSSVKVGRTAPIKLALSGIANNSGVLSSQRIKFQTASGTSSNSGSLATQTITVLTKLVTGACANSGALLTALTLKRTVSGASTNSGSLHKTIKGILVSGVSSCAGAISMTLGTFFKLAFDDQDPTVDGTVKYLVEISDSPIPDTTPSNSSLYERGLREAPVFDKETGDASSGVSGLSKVTLRVSNLSGVFNTKDIEGFFVRILRVLASQVTEFQGVVTEWTLDSDVEILVEDREAIVFSEQLPKGEITKDTFSKLPDKDAGKAIKVFHNQATKIPCRLVGVDEVAREWDYELGYGVGKFGNWQDVSAVYHIDSALGDITGTADSGGASFLELESADERPEHFYQYWWVEITSGTGAGQIRHVTAYDQSTNRITPDTNFSPAPDNTSVYELKEWRFYDGSQGSPYAGIAFIRLKKRLGANNRLDDLFADVDALPADNVVREIEDWLENTTWGLGLTVDSTTFDALAGDAELSNIKTEWGIEDKTDAGDLIESLLEVRGMSLVKEGNSIKIEADASKTSAGTFGYGDGFYDNIARVNGGVKHANVRDKIKNLKIHYRRNYKEPNTFLGSQNAEANSSGIDDELFVPQFFGHEDANRYLYYKIKKLVSEATSLSITVGEEGEALRARDRITVKIPHLSIDSDWLIRSISRANGLYTLELNPYDDTTYTWSQLGFYPTDPGSGLVTDFSRTNPDPVGGLSATAGVRTTEGGDRIGYIDVSWTVPNDGNYMDAEVSIKENGQPASSYKSVGFGIDSFRIDGLEANESFDILVESRNEYNLKGTGTEDLNNSTGSSTSAPSTPSAPTGTRSGRTVTFKATPPSSTIKIKNFDWEVDFISGGTDYSVDEHGTTLSVTVDGTGSFTVRARLRARNIYDQLSSFSSYSSSISNEKWASDHYGDSSVVLAKIGNSQVDSDKRITAFTHSHTFSNFNLVDGAKKTQTMSRVHNLGRRMIATLRAQHNISGTTGVIGSSYVDAVTTTKIDTRYEVLNEAGVTVSNISITHEIFYW